MLAVVSDIIFSMIGMALQLTGRINENIIDSVIYLKGIMA